MITRKTHIDTGEIEVETKGDAILSTLIFSTLFLNSYILFRTPFEGYISYVVIILLTPLMMLKFKFPTKLLKTVLLPLGILGVFTIYQGLNTSGAFMKIYISICINAVFFGFVMQLYNFDVERMFRIYLKGCIIVCVIGAVQLVSFIIGFKIGYDFSFILNKWGVGYSPDGIGIRINSIFSEPSYLGASLSPALFVAGYQLVSRKALFLTRAELWLIIIVYMLTLSSVAYIGVFILVILMLINYGLVRYIMIISPFAIIGFYYLYDNFTDFRDRLDGLTDLYSGDKSDAQDVHGSSYVLYNNYIVALENIKHNPIWGSGLGSHEFAYHKYSLENKAGINIFNTSDANSMFLRLMSELGVIGVLGIIAFVYLYFVRRKPGESNDVYWVMSNACLMIIILQLLRQGNYTYNGFFFYMWLYFYIKKVAAAEDLRIEEALVTENASDEIAPTRR